MKRVLEGILAVLIAVLSCIVFINVILRLRFWRAVFLSVDELSRYLFCMADVYWSPSLQFMDNAHVQVTFVGGKTFASESASSLATDAFADFIVMPRIRLGQPAKSVAGLERSLANPRFTDRPDVYRLSAHKRCHRVNRAASALSLNNA